jgi:hypothetical protein
LVRAIVEVAMRILALALLLVSASVVSAEETTTVPAPLPLPRLSVPITLDGDPSDAAWESAARIDTFYETVFGDNRVPTVKTTMWLAYDDHAFWVGIRCEDPEPGKIRAPFVDRDNVLGDQDNVAVFIDARNDRRSAQEFRVNPRGVQGDALFNDANFNEDFSPDFFYETKARITSFGWTAEMRIPFSTLRYPKADPQTWGILLWRNYPRAYRYAIYSSPIPRDANCSICLSRSLTGLTGLPSAGHLVVAPYASAQGVASADAPGRPLGSSRTTGRAGADLKWNPNADTTLDATANPDFSQVEGDVAQIAVNNRFALFFPEKRPFFLEGVDLLDTPIQAVYTRTITAPRWGARATGKVGPNAYTVLLTQDQGGGSVILPGATASDLAPQDFHSLVGIGRWRRDVGRSFVGMLYTGREISGGGHNRVIGPDLQWRPTARDTITGQLLLSDTQTPRRTDLTSAWTGDTLRSHGAVLSWGRQTQTVDWFLRGHDFGEGFRADSGFVPQVGYRDGYGEVGYSLFPKHGLFARLRPYAFVLDAVDRHGALVNRRIGPGVNFNGRKNLTGFAGINIDRVRIGSELLSRTQVVGSASIDPSRRLPRIGVNWTLGGDVDVANVRTGRGGELSAFATLRPTDHLQLNLNTDVGWLSVDAGGAGGRARLFTAQVQRLKATYNLSARSFLRVIGQYVTTRRDPLLYAFEVQRHDAGFSGSALFSYRLNWQTALYLGYGDERALDAADHLGRTERQLFAKLSYAFQR